MKIYLIKLYLSPKEGYFVKSECNSIKFNVSTGSYNVKVNEYAKVIAPGALNKVKLNKTSTDRNPEYYQNFIYCEDVEKGKKELLEAYNRHYQRSVKTYANFLGMVEEV